MTLLLMQTMSAGWARGQQTNVLDPIDVLWIGATSYPNNTPCTWGVPFAKGTVKPGTQFTLETTAGPIDLDCYTLAYWPDGSVKWGGFAGVVPAEAQPQQLTVKALPTKGKRRKAEQSSPLIASRDNGQIVVSTSTLTARFTRGGEALFDYLVLNGDTVAGALTLQSAIERTTGDEGHETTIRNSYRSRVDSIAVERAGTVSAVVRVSGQHCADGRSWLPFIVRFYFNEATDQVRMVHTIVYDGDMEQDHICRLGVDIEVPLRERLYNRHVAFSTGDGGVWTEPVQPLVGRRVLGARQQKGLDWQQYQMRGERVPDYDEMGEYEHRYLDAWASWNNYRLSQLSSSGFSIRKQANSSNPWIGTFDGRRSEGMAFVGDLTGGLGVALQEFWQSYPSTLEVSDARQDRAHLKVWLWSPEGEAMNLQHYDNVAHGLEESYEDIVEGLSTPYGIARTSTLTLYPTNTFPKKAGIAALAQQGTSTPQLTCTPQYLHNQHAFGRWSLPSDTSPLIQKVEKRLSDYVNHYKCAIDEHCWYGFWNYGDVMHAYDENRHEWRYDIGGYAWDNTELASNMWLWYNYLRTGRADLWQMAIAMTRHTSEVDVYHLGKYAGLGSRHNVSHWGCGCKQVRIGQSAWIRFLYYLTGDERSGELLTEKKDADYSVLEHDPMGVVAPREKSACTAPGRVSIGPDWFGYACNWMTQWERTGDLYYRNKLIRSMKSIAALPQGMFTGPIALGYDPATGIVSKEGDSTMVATSHLTTLMGGFEFMNELDEMVPMEAWRKVWLDYCDRYKEMAWQTRKNRFRIVRLMGYAAWQKGDEAKGRQAWHDLLRGTDLDNFGESLLQAPEVPAPTHEVYGITTNGTATWSLDAIYLLEACPQWIGLPEQE